MKYQVTIDHECYCDADSVRSMLRLEYLLEELLDGLTPMQSEHMDEVLETLRTNPNQIDVQLSIKEVNND
tara:strand:+ start:112 stop:321 length:210 start_codon:yes stop_codon:yes gene_type:complete